MDSLPKEASGVNGQPQANGAPSTLPPDLARLKELLDAKPELQNLLDADVRELLYPTLDTLPREWPQLEPLPQCRTARAVVELYLAMGTEGLHPRTLATTQKVLAEFVKDFGHCRLKDCRPLELLAWLGRHPEYKSGWTKNRVLTTIKRPFNWCVLMGVIPANPFGKISHPVGDRGRPMEPSELRTILRNTDGFFKRLVFFLLWTGARPGEATALQWDQIDLERCACVLKEHKTKKTRRDRKPRTIILHPAAVKLLLWLYRQPRRKASSHVFTNEDGTRWTRSSLGLRLYRLRKRTGLPDDCRLYGARHLFATTAIKNGVDVTTLAELMGHTDVRMTMHYLHLAGETKHLREAVVKALRNRHRRSMKEGGAS